MKKFAKKHVFVLAMILVTCLLGFGAAASEDDNSLADLGIATEGAQISPAFAYDTWTYDVTVPAGTSQLELSPSPSSQAASIADISGTTLDEDGSGTVYITVRSGSGAEFTYTLNVHADTAQAAPAAGGESSQEPGKDAAGTPETTPAPETEITPQTETETEPQTEDTRYVKVDRNAIQEAENTITGLKEEITGYRDTISLYTKIMYGLIALAVVLLFLVINFLLRGRDLKAQVKDLKAQALPQGVQSRPMPQEQRPAPAGGGQVPPQYYPQGGQLDVMPQTSQKKARRLPRYAQQPPIEVELTPPDASAQGKAAAAPQTQPQPQAAQTQAPKTPTANAQAPSTGAQSPASAPQAPAQTGEAKAGGERRDKRRSEPEVNMIDL